MPVSASTLGTLAAALSVDAESTTSLAKLGETTLLEASAAIARSQQRLLRETAAAFQIPDPTAGLRAAVSGISTTALGSYNLAAQLRGGSCKNCS